MAVNGQERKQNLTLRRPSVKKTAVAGLFFEKCCRFAAYTADG
jgi:hypothetical protein